MYVLEDVMRKQLFVPMLVGMLALGAVQAFAQSATVVMRNGDRVRADVIDMGRNFTLNVNGQTRLANNVMLDGIDNNHKTGLLTVVIPSADAIEAVSVIAQTGGKGFGTRNLLTIVRIGPVRWT